MSQTRPSSPVTVALTVTVGTILIGIDTTIVNIAIPQLAHDLGASLSVIQWVITGYTLALATVMPATAWAIARFGAKRVFLLSIGLFTAGSALVAASWSPESLIAFRVVQGIGGGSVLPAAMTLALAATPSEQRGRIMAVLGLPMLIGPVLGPVVGGLLLDNLSWKWMFLINVPFGIASLLLGLRNLPRTAKGPGRSFDVRGLLLLSPAMALLVLGTSLADSSLLTAQVLLPVGVGLALIAIFIWHALRADAPLLDIRVLTRPFTGSAAIVLFLFSSGWVAGMLLVPLYWQLVRGESATTAGLFIAPAGLAAGISIQISGRLIDRVAPLRVIGTGLAVATAATTALLLLMGTETPAWILVALWATAAAGAGFTVHHRHPRPGRARPPRHGHRTRSYQLHLRRYLHRRRLGRADLATGRPTSGSPRRRHRLATRPEPGRVRRRCTSGRTIRPIRTVGAGRAYGSSTDRRQRGPMERTGTAESGHLRQRVVNEIGKRMNMTGNDVFNLPERLAAKRDPALTEADRAQFAAIASSLADQRAQTTARLDELRRSPGGSGQEAMERDLEIHRLTARLPVQ